ncbi:amidohydrolase family protein [Quadrisphaera sp. INWT6]|nr:amidohydrolase family protein [Quadrisphaera sp. INWT6]
MADRPGGPDLVDVLLEGGRVASVLPAGTAARSEGRPAEVVDLDGRWLLPGLWDEHVHLGQWALVQRRLDVSGATSAAHAAQLVRERAAAEAEAAVAGGTTGVLVGSGFRDGLWPDAPSAELLDGAVAGAGDRPVVLVSGDLHCAWLSSAAARDVAGPLGVVPDACGLVREEAAFAVQRALAALDDGALDAAVAAALARAASLGVVGVVDLEMTDSPGGTAAVWARRVDAAGRTASAGLRVEAGTYPQHLEEAVALGVRSGLPLAGAPGASSLVVGGPLKVITDGSLGTRTACCLDAYPGRTGPGSHGELTWPLEQLVPLLRRGRAAGLVPAVHAIGDAAVRTALDALEAAGPWPAGGRGARIEHAQLVADDDVPRFAALGVTASAQPAHLLDDRETAEVHWPGRTHRAFPLRSLLDAGARLALGSDAPVAALDPWLAMTAAVARSWHPEQAVTPLEALTASTRGRSAVAAGDPADVVAVDDEPLALLDAGRRPGVALTAAAGRVVHDAV